MVTQYSRETKVNHDLLSFLKNIGCSGIQFKILSYWVRHPKSRLSFYTVARALDTARLDLRNAMSALVEKGVLTEQRDGAGLTTYALAYNDRINGYIKELAKLDCSEAINLRRQLVGNSIITNRTGKGKP
jgi:hypothetical protein